MKTKLVFADGSEIEMDVGASSPLAEGLVWSAHLDIPRPKDRNEFTVVGVYVDVPLDDPRHGERFADCVIAATWQEAEAQVAQRRGVEASIAAVLRDHLTCVDEQ